MEDINLIHTFLEKSEKDPLTKRDKSTIMGFYEDAKYLWDNWKQENAGGKEAAPFKVRRIMLVYLVDKNGKRAHSKPIVLFIRWWSSEKLCRKVFSVLRTA